MSLFQAACGDCSGLRVVTNILSGEQLFANVDTVPLAAIKCLYEVLGEFLGVAVRLAHFLVCRGETLG